MPPRYHAHDGHAVRLVAGGLRWYDTRERLVALRSAAGGNGCEASDVALPNSVQHLRYDLLPEGVVGGITDLSAVSSLPRLDATFTNDRLNQLTGAKWRVEGVEIRYAYDTIQNLVRQTVTSSSAALAYLSSGDLDYAGPGGGPNAVKSAFGDRYSYNAAGQLHAYNGFWLVFDVDGRLAEASKADGTRLRWYYDTGGERRLKVSRLPGAPAHTYWYPFDGYQRRDGVDTWSLTAAGERLGEVSYGPPPALTLAGVDALSGAGAQSPELAGALKAYWTGAAAGSSEERARYYHPDHIGGPGYVTSGAGTLESSTAWYPYGTTAAELGPRPNHTFAGAEREPEQELGLIQLGARW